MILKWMRVMCRPFRFSPFRVSSQPPPPTPGLLQPLALSPLRRAPATAAIQPRPLFLGSLGLGYLVSSGCLPLPVCPPASPWNCFLL